MSPGFWKQHHPIPQLFGIIGVRHFDKPAFAPIRTLAIKERNCFFHIVETYDHQGMAVATATRREGLPAVLIFAQAVKVGCNFKPASTG